MKNIFLRFYVEFSTQFQPMHSSDDYVEMRFDFKWQTGCYINVFKLKFYPANVYNAGSNEAWTVLVFDVFQIQCIYHFDSMSQYIYKLCWNNVDSSSVCPVGSIWTNSLIVY
jgi:hypothetical protein